VEERSCVRPFAARILLLTSDNMSHTSKLDLLQGTLDLLILRNLQAGPQHGWAISERIQQVSQEVLHQGSLYPALHRLQHQGGMGHLRTGPAARPVLPPDRRWTQATGNWKPNLGANGGAIGRVLEMASYGLDRLSAAGSRALLDRRRAENDLAEELNSLLTSRTLRRSRRRSMTRWLRNVFVFRWWACSAPSR
jgi:hypothetical protein